MRSRLEADYAAHLDSAGYRWAYEPECFAGPAGQWLPDFGCTFAPEGQFGIFTEVKPVGPFKEARAMPPAHFDYADRFLKQMTIAWGSRPDAQLDLVFWEYGADMPHLHLFSQRKGEPWFAWNSGGTILIWPGMGQLARLRAT